MNYFQLFLILSLSLLGIEISHAINPKDTLVPFYVEKIKLKIENNQYLEANDLFKKLFARNAVLPDDVAYYYGITQLNLSKYAKCKEALLKYLSLQGANGLYSEDARIAIIKADCLETGYREEIIECDVCFGDSTLDINCRSCKGKGIETCITCKGSGVSKTTGSFGSSYQTCTRCAGEKIIKCTTCKGNLKEHTICYNCNGKGNVKIRKKCTN